MQDSAYAIYLRKSREDIESEKYGEGETLARHEKILTTLAEKRNLTIGKIYREVVSGETISERKEMQKAIKKLKPESILILGTSDGMVEKIAENLGLPKIQKTIYIQDVATETEMQTARNIRVTQGKHVIPVPTFEIKKDFSGYILDPLQIFKSKGSGNKPYISEKSIIRPTFSYLGNFTISDTVFRQIVEYLAKKTEGISRVIRTRVENYGEGPSIYMEVSVIYGHSIIKELRVFKEKCIKEIERLTTMSVQKITVIAKAIEMPEKKTKN